MNEIAWQHHLQQAAKADELYASLRELYGDEHMDNPMLYRRARFDKVITEDERALLSRMRP